MSFIPFLQAAGGAGSASTSASFIGTLVPFLLIIVIFYFFLIRPQNKKQKETEKMLSALKKGDRIVTIGGIHGTVSSVKEKTVIVKVDDSTKLEFNRSAISSVENPESEKSSKSGKTDKSEKKDSAEADKTEETVPSEEK